MDTLQDYLFQLSKELADDCHKKRLMGKTISIKVKYDDFRQVTRSQTFRQGIDDARQIFEISKQLLTRTEAGRRKVRLVGIGMSSLEYQAEQLEQLELDLKR